MDKITYNPILDKKDLSGWRLFQKRPIPEPGNALVFSGEGQPLLTLTQGQKGLTSGEMFWGKYNWLYKVDLTEHPLEFKFDLPCKSDAYDFHTEVNFICSVRDSAMIVERNVNDVRQWLEPKIIDALRRISRNYEVNQSGIAEREMSPIVSQKIYDQGFTVSDLVLKVSLEDEARTEIRNRKRRETANQEEKTQLQNQLEIEKHKQELEKQRFEFELEKERQRQQFEAEMRQQKAKMYGEMLQSGQLQLLAFQLAQNPQDIAGVVQYLNQQQQSEREHQLNILKTLLDADALEGWQLSDVGKKALQSLVGATEASTPLLEDSKSNNTENQKSESQEEDIEGEVSDSVNSEPDFNWEKDG